MLSHAQSQSQSASSSGAKSALLDRKIEECAAGLAPSVSKQLFSINKDNAATIVKYIEEPPQPESSPDSVLSNLGFFAAFTMGLKGPLFGGEMLKYSDT